MSQQSPLNSTYFVSVIIPIFNDIQGLKICLEAIKNQTYPQTFFEVIVIDNASNNSDSIKNLTKQYNNVLYEYESKIGSYAARNKGLSVARGEIIAFTDADCIPADDWLEKGIIKLSSVFNCGLIGGKINLIYLQEKPITPVELYESVMAFRQEEFITENHFSVTANMFTWKKVIEKVGFFNDNLKSSGDLDWGRRVYASGYFQLYASDVSVTHPSRYSFSQLYKQTIRHTGGIYDLYLRSEFPKTEGIYLFLKYILLNLMPPVSFALKIFKNPQIDKLKDKFTIILVFFLVRLITLLEICRLLLGKNSSRE
ncbi:glycosyltransferase family 2 protein [Geminocystis sp.]|uniref:glycosyltransferase n=1 Tax=Geminocystis sp. TaxID=2664100 RepID=UPI003593533D